MNDAQKECLLDILANTEVPEKVTVKLDPVSRDVTITYQHMDSEWFKELEEASR